MSRKKLIEAQMREWPDSVILTLPEVYKWCDQVGVSVNERLRRYAQISMALQYPHFVFYRIEGTTFRGFRYGTEGHEYMSFYAGE